MIYAKKWRNIFLIEGICCALGVILLGFQGTNFIELLGIPMEGLAIGLRNLSLSGPVGNFFAILCYLILGLCPIGVFYWFRKKSRASKVDFFLYVVSISFLITMYYMINPGLFMIKLPKVAKAILPIGFYGVFFAYIILRRIEYYAKADIQKIQSALKGLILFSGMILVYLAFGKELRNLIGNISLMLENEGGRGGAFSLYTMIRGDYIFLVLSYLVKILSYILDIVIILQGVTMLDALMEDRYSDKAVRTVENMATLCVKSLMISVIVSISFNLLQVIFHQSIRNMHLVMELPLTFILFVLGVLLFTRYIQEDQILKNEHDLFI